jgi:4-amino-4-deoxy-L-arabinose transferase-like glycosyltransferase
MWATTDEPFHVLAAREMKNGPGVVSNLEHPVGMKLLAAAALPESPRGRANDAVHDARRPFAFLFGALVLTVGWWTSRRASPALGLAAAALVAIDPSLRAHGTIVQSDVPVTLLLVLAAALVDLGADARDGRRRALPLAGAAAAYGLAIATKFSAAVFAPVFLALAFVRLRATDRRRAWTRTAAIAAGALVAALLVQELALMGTDRAALREAATAQLSDWGVRSPRLLSTMDRLPKGTAAYAAGLALVKASSAPGARYNYFAGRLSGNGFVAYFPVALAVKTPTALLLATAALLLALAVALARARRTRARRLRRVLAARAGFPAALAAAYLALCMTSHVDIGVRHAFPAGVLALVAAAGAARVLVPRRALPRIVAAVIVLSAVEAAGRFGREIPFGNLFVGGPSGVHRVISDSNVDWGQAQGALFERVRKGDLGRVGVASLVLDEPEAIRGGVAERPDSASKLAGLDTAIVSVHLLDVAHAAAKNDEPFARYRELKGWLVPLVSEVETRFVATERLGDEYVIYRRPAQQGSAHRS